MNKFFSAQEYLFYLFESKTKYYIHSPFVFSFINDVLNDKRDFYCYNEIEKLRNELKENELKIDVDDFGAGSLLENRNKRSISFIAKTSAAPQKYAQLLFRIIQFYKCENILELGTSLGVTTSYLSAINYGNKIYSIEGSHSIAAEAKKNFQSLERTNIQLIIGKFEERLNPTLNEMKHLDFLYLDGNHRLEPTINYFKQCLPYLNENSIVVLDDIYWSPEMKQAWNQIKSNASVTLSIDLFRMGILFFRKDKNKEHFRLRF